MVPQQRLWNKEWQNVGRQNVKPECQCSIVLTAVFQDKTMKYLFWNTHKNTDINSILCDLVEENGISILVLAEYTASIDELIMNLYERGISMNKATTFGCERIYVLKNENLEMQPLLQTDHATIQLIHKSIILCGVHLKSQIHSDHQGQREIRIEGIVNDIRKYEQYYNTSNTIIVGDFNINPYDSTCMDARYFHAIPVYEDAKRKTRKVAGREFFMFYNPMWNLLGDFNMPLGTYYHNSGKTINTYWNLYDQVIIRPDLRKRFVNESLKILTATSNTQLIAKNGHPNKTISDHLPITFEIKEP